MNNGYNRNDIHCAIISQGNFFFVNVLFANKHYKGFPFFIQLPLKYYRANTYGSKIRRKIYNEIKTI
jgi:hypothetical protein